MNNYKLYIAGALILLFGLVIGWLLKPAQNSYPVEDYSSVDSKNQEAQDNDVIWTCSMHPQIRQKEKGICPICEMDLIPLDNNIGNDNPLVLKMTKEAVKLAQVETFIVGGEDLITAGSQKNGSYINVDGTIALDERTIKSQTAHLGGRIEEMSISFEGQYVQKGQKIASIYSTDLLAASQELITAARYNDQIEGLENAAIQKLQNWKVTDDQVQDILISKKPKETLDIYADHSGYVLQKIQSQGDYVKQGQVLFTIGSTYNLWLIFNVYESDLASVKVGSTVYFTTPSLPEEEFLAKVSYIDPLLNEKTRTATLRAEIKNKGNKLKPGMLLNGRVITSKNYLKNKKDAPLTVPNSAILWTGDRSVVYVQLEDENIPTYKFKEVKILSRNNNYSVVDSGIIVGDRVVTHGAFAIDAAAQLNNNQSMINRNIQIKQENTVDKVPSYKEQTPSEFKNQLDNVVEQYLSLKNALVETDPNNAQETANLLLEALSGVNMQLLKGEAHVYWAEQLKVLKKETLLIKEAGDIEEQRQQFDFLSAALINVLKAFGTNDKTYYVQYCPMAKDNQGADWISSEKQIRNPYFGAKMMKCGTVKLTIN